MPETQHPGFTGPVNWTAENLPNNSHEATARTIERMYQYIREDSSSPIVRRALNEAAHPTLRMTSPGVTASLIFGYIRRRVRFVADPENAAKIEAARIGGWKAHEIELLIRPVDLLRMKDPSGDCDDFSMLAAAMLSAAGIPAELVTIAANAEAPDEWSHVYVLATIDGQPTPFDCSHGRAIGWEYQQATKKAVWKRIDDPMQLGHLSGDPASEARELMTRTQPQTTPANSWWQDIAKIGAEAAARRYATTPALQYRTGPDGQIQYTQYQPQPAFSATFPGLPGMPANGGISSTWLLLGGIALVAVLAISAKGN